jgi:two-component system chemotaxis sensor kinase CheA
MSQTGTGTPGARPVDLAQFHQVFFEEAAEHLTEMERLLVRIDPASPEDEELNAIFRAAHSIKGGAATFGFSDMAELTHELESLLDRLRKHEIGMTADMVDALLAGGDALNLQLARHRGDGDASEPDALGVGARIRALRDGATTGSSSTANETAQCTAPAPLPARTLEIHFTLGADTGGEDTKQNIRSELATLGALEDISAAAGSEAQDRHAFRLETAASDEDIRDRFAFSIDPAHIEIRTLPAADPGFGFFDDPASGLAPGPAADPGYGFFDAEPGQPAADCGWGLFDDARPQAVAQAAAPAAAQAEHAAEAATSQGRRASDAPEADVARSGRRDTDKTVIGQQAENSSIRVGVEKVDQLINEVGELVITQAMLAQEIGKLDPAAYQALFTAMGNLERNTRNLQESVMSIRMMPIAFSFNRFPRMVRDLAGKLGKQVQLVMSGEQTELDKGLIEKISDPLTHLVRNSVDHGIEMPEDRVAAGKPAQGTVLLSASHRGGSIVIEVSDDGHGLNRERILAKARERGMTVSNGLADAEVWQLIFEAGFSTAEVVTDVSGRGVGMDVVRRNIGALGGAIDIQSTNGAGTRFTVRLPLTLAILDGMSVSAGGETYLVPLSNVIESMQVPADKVRTVGGQARVIEMRNEYLPVMSLEAFFTGASAAASGAGGIMVIIEAEGAKTALLVDELLGQHQIVVKNLETNFRKVPGIAAATIMGDGRVALILDAPALVRMARH